MTDWARNREREMVILRRNGIKPKDIAEHYKISVKYVYAITRLGEDRISRYERFGWDYFNPQSIPKISLEEFDFNKYYGK